MSGENLVKGTNWSGDYSRFSYDDEKGYVMMLKEQGVPLLDDELNMAQLAQLSLLRNGLFSAAGDGSPDSGMKIVGIGAVNDFQISPGRYLLNGWPLKLATSVLYSSQPQTQAALTTPIANRTDAVYLDIWTDEVDTNEDINLKDPTLNRRTSSRLKLFWAVKVAEGGAVPADGYDANQLYHWRSQIATIRRIGGNATITAGMVQDTRPSLGRGGSSGEGTSAVDYLYSELLSTQPYSYIYYDAFTDFQTMAPSGNPIPVYADPSDGWNFQPGGILISNELLPSGNPGYRTLYLHAEQSSTAGITASKSVDGGTTWTNFTLDEPVILDSFTTTLRVRFIATGAGALSSFGVLYEALEEGFASIPESMMVELYVEDELVGGPKLITIPNGARYTPNGKTLSVYYNREKAVFGHDYLEVDEFTIQWLNGLSPGDFLEFHQRYLPTQGTSIGDNVLLDQATNLPYRISVLNGSLIITEQSSAGENPVSQYIMTDDATGIQYQISIYNATIRLTAV